MDDLLQYLPKDWGIWTVLVVILVKLFSSQLISFLPQTIQDYLSSRTKLKADRQEHEQEIQLGERNLLRLKELSELSKDNFPMEQVTALTSELQVQLDTSNEFIRRVVSNKLDMIIENQQFILRELRNGKKSETNRLEQIS